MPRPRRWLLAGVVLLVQASGVRADDFAIRDGDTVVFLGDSITAARTYGKIVEDYTLMRFPDRKVRFFNEGRGGDTAAGGLARLDRDVFAHEATLVVVAYGINDIGWGTKADDTHRQAYLDAVAGIVDRCRERGVRAAIASAAITAEDPQKAESGDLQRMCDDGLARAREHGARTIDVQRGMRAIQRSVRTAAAEEKVEKDRPTLHAADGVHPSDLGQLAMAFAILEGLGAPADVSSVAIDGEAAEVRGCRVTNLVRDGPRVEFDRLDDGLPLGFDIFSFLKFRFVPVPDRLNRYLLTVRGLPAGRYAIAADGRGLGTFGAKALAAGVNLTSATANGFEPGGPWEVQGVALNRVTDARHEAAAALHHVAHFLPGHPELTALQAQADEADARLVALQRSLARPRPYHFVVRPAP